MLTACSALGVRYLVVDAEVAAAQGQPPSSGDLDLWIEPTPPNAARAWRALAAFGAPLRSQGISERDLATPGFTCQLGVFAAERGDVAGLRRWFIITYVMGAIFIGGQALEYAELIHEGVTIPSSAYGTMFYLTTGFHGIHVTGGLIAFLFVLGRTYIARKFTHEQAVSAIVTSYYWHFVDVVWIALFATIYLIQ